MSRFLNFSAGWRLKPSIHYREIGEAAIGYRSALVKLHRGTWSKDPLLHCGGHVPAADQGSQLRKAPFLRIPQPFALRAANGSSPPCFPTALAGAAEIEHAQRRSGRSRDPDLYGNVQRRSALRPSYR